eukprot:TRINITY_DN2884_c0_g1_i1.p1 TRINITY_DN2884_c0_g1~~TRINITY_DN2884_c0_g1_i1.p1  ORF type:complete len:231 (+),score=25.78 TRINITY_DN2884_c0_g1_i1:303-995(+)
MRRRSKEPLHRRLLKPLGVDALGNVYVADRDNNRVVVVSPEGEGREICHVSSPYGLCVSRAGTVYVTNSLGIVKIARQGEAYEAAPLPFNFDFLLGIDIDEYDNIYVCDSGNNMIKRVSPDGVLSVVAGSGKEGCEDGPGDVATFKQPWGVTVDRYGCIYVAGWYSQCIRKIIPSNALITDWPSSHGLLPKQAQSLVEIAYLTFNNLAFYLPLEMATLICKTILRINLHI